jgi:hypothetical protein
MHAGLGATADENLTAEVVENAEYLLSPRALCDVLRADGHAAGDVTADENVAQAAGLPRGA